MKAPPPLPPHIRFSEMPQLDETGMNKQWIRYPRKKTSWNGGVYLLKVQGEKSMWQAQADWLKEAFDLPKLGVELVFDDELQKVGCLIPWFENSGHLAQAPWQQWATQTNLRQLVKIGVFDAVIGNSDRVVSNVLVRPDGSLLPIDEGEQERFEWAKMPTGHQKMVLRNYRTLKIALWVKYRNQLLQLLATTLKDRRWLDVWVAELPERVKMLPKEVVRPYYESQLARLDEVVEETVCQIQRT